MNRKLPDGKQVRIRRPIRRTAIFGTTVFFLTLSVALLALSYTFITSSLYQRYNSKLNDILVFVENNTDPGDLKACLETGVASEKYRALQAMLNKMVDDFELEYLYVVIPSEETMANAISATSAAERAAGETDMAILETTDAYSREELLRYLSYWDSEGVSYFEESSEYGDYYTALKPLRDSAGKTVALMCADVSISSLHGFISRFMLFTVLAISLICGLGGVLMLRWLRRSIVDPIHLLERQSYDYVQKVKRMEGDALPAFEPPALATQNEVQSLSETIGRMAEDAQAYITRAIVAQERAAKAEEHARAAERIAELTESMTALLTHMPALTFSKDIRTGRYLACNQAFAEYAHKAEPAGVAGLTDHEIFDKATADHFVEDDQKTLAMDAPYVFYEDVTDAAGNPRQFQTTKLKFTDATGRLCLLGMSLDVTEMTRIKREQIKTEEAYEEAVSASVTYSRIAQALSTDYFNIFYVDLETDRFVEYSSMSSGDELAEQRIGEDFFAQSQRDALTLIHEDDQEHFLNAFTKPNILASLDENGAFTIQYRLLLEGRAVHVSMKASRMPGDDRHIIIGVNNIEAQMKQQLEEERIKEERITYSRITALSGDYIYIYTVDPKTQHFIEYAVDKEYHELGLAAEGDGFFAQAQMEMGEKIYVEDMERVTGLFTSENVMRVIQREGIFVLDYRLMMEGIPTYVRLKAAMVAEKDGPQLIVGVSNIDAQVKREQEYANNLTEARNQANIDALTGVKNKHAYIDIEAQLNHQIDEKRNVEFAIVVFDVNDLKSVNDRQGHQAGDRVIRSASQVICGVFKRSPVFRVGGDEFAVIAQGHDYQHIDELLERIRAHNDHHGDKDGIVIACGMAKYRGDRSVSMVFERADQRMYENKRKLKEQ